MPDPVDILMDEHRTIEKVLAALRAAASREMPLDFYARAADFIANYADACHHGKEEDRLFPVLEERGIPREGGPIGVMCDEHVLGRGHVRRMREAVAAGDRGGVLRAAAAYVALLEQHILKEDRILFPMGRSVLSPELVARLEASFAEVDPDGDTARHYRALADTLLAEARG